MCQEATFEDKWPMIPELENPARARVKVSVSSMKKRKVVLRSCDSPGRLL
jgi:hypothetical protein